MNLKVITSLILKNILVKASYAVLGQGKIRSLIESRSDNIIYLVQSQKLNSQDIFLLINPFRYNFIFYKKTTHKIYIYFTFFIFFILFF